VPVKHCSMSFSLLHLSLSICVCVFLLLVRVVERGIAHGSLSLWLVLLALRKVFLLLVHLFNSEETLLPDSGSLCRACPPRFKTKLSISLSFLLVRVF
jgi:hypothetical protein